MSRHATRKRSIQRPLLVIFLVVLVNVLGFGIIIPLLPYYAGSLGATPLQVGALFAIFSLAQLFASPVLGSLSDSVGRRPVLIFSLLGTVASFSLMALASNLALLFVARLIDGLTGGNIATARAYIADATGEQERAKAYGLIGAAFGLGFIIGPGAGGLLARIDYAAPAWAAAALALGAAALCWAWLPETRRRKHEMGNEERGSLLPEDAEGFEENRTSRGRGALLRRTGVARLLTLDGLYWAASSVFQTSFAIFVAHRFGFDVATTGLLFALAGVIGVFVQVRLVGRLAGRYGEGRLLSMGLALLGAGIGVIALVYQTALFVAAMVGAAVGAALAGPALFALLSRAVDPEEQGRMQGLSSAVESLGRVVGPVWGGGLIETLGDGAAYGSAAVVLLLIAVWAAVAARGRGLSARRG